MRSTPSPSLVCASRVPVEYSGTKAPAISAQPSPLPPVQSMIVPPFCIKPSADWLSRELTIFN